MILNPVIQGGSEEKVYKITGSTTVFGFPETAKPGELVYGTKEATISLYVSSKEFGVSIPISVETVNSMSRVIEAYNYWFIMPCSDVEVIAM